MAIEINSHAVHYSIADVNIKTDKIYRHLDYGSLTTTLSSGQSSSEKPIFRSHKLKELQLIFQKLRIRQEHFKVVKAKAIATDAFINIPNAKELIKKLRHASGIDIRILTTEEEDKLDFFSGLTVAENEENTVVWVIGKSGYQLTISKASGDIVAYQSEFGSSHFVKYFRDIVQKKLQHPSDLLSPISIQDIENGIKFARFLAQNTSNIILNELNKDNVIVVGIGSIFQDVFYNNITQKNMSLSKEELESYILNQITIENSDTTIVPCAILTFGFMKELEISQISISDHNRTVSMLEYPILWL